MQNQFCYFEDVSYLFCLIEHVILFSDSLFCCYVGCYLRQSSAEKNQSNIMLVVQKFYLCPYVKKIGICCIFFCLFFCLFSVYNRCVFYCEKHLKGFKILEEYSRDTITGSNCQKHLGGLDSKHEMKMARKFASSPLFLGVAAKSRSFFHIKKCYFNKLVFWKNYLVVFKCINCTFTAKYTSEKFIAK